MSDFVYDRGQWKPRAKEAPPAPPEPMNEVKPIAITLRVIVNGVEVPILVEQDEDETNGQNPTEPTV